MTAHSPLPWTFWHADIADASNQQVLKLSQWDEIHKPNGEFIVRAANSHEKLVMACQFALNCSRGLERDYFDRLPRDLEAALAAAEGEKK